MKKVKIFVLMLVAGAAIFTSCKKDDETTYANPTVTFQSGVNTLTFNGTNSISSNVTLAAEAKIESVKLQSPNTTGSAGNSTTDITLKMGTSANQSAKGETSAIYLFNVSSADLALAFALNSTTTLTYTFTVTDQEGTSSTGSFTVTMAASTTPLAYENTSGVVWNLIGANEGAWDLGANVAMASGDAEANKDMKNTSSVANGWVNAWTTGIGNGTLYVKAAAGFDYTNATVESATAAYAAGTGAATVTGPATNDIYIAKLRGGSNYAVIKITNVVVTASDNNDKIEFSYKKLTSSSI